MFGGIVGLMMKGSELRSCVNYGFSSGKQIFGEKTKAAGNVIDCREEYVE